MAQIIRTPRNDDLVGTSVSNNPTGDLPRGGSGDDQLFGGNGRDLLLGDDGADDRGDDDLLGGTGGDRLEGGEGEWRRGRRCGERGGSVLELA